MTQVSKQPTYLDIANIIEANIGSYECSNGMLQDVTRTQIEEAALALLKAGYDKQ